MPETVLITTHDLESAVELRDAFREDGTRVELLTAHEDVGDVEEPVLLIITGGLDGKRARALIRQAAERGHVPVIGLVDDPGSIERRAGVSDHFAKPIDAEAVVLVGRRLIERKRLQAVTGIVGETDAMHEVLERVVQIAPVHATVLVTGESGTGKELVARGLHALSGRRNRPFIPANVAALSDTLLESELFGHEKGAFTGAVAQRKGLFELADGGTLFLDELGEMPLATQTKLLRVLEERQFMRVGGEGTLDVDVRVVAATNQDLRQQVELGEFRRDLYYRLNVLHIELPPLRERRADIPRLIDAFVRETSREHDRPEVTLSREAMKILADDYEWPGNVRELRNLVESMVVLAPGRVITPDDIPPHVRTGSRGRSLLPVPISRAERKTGTDDEGGKATPPELEFIFRTLLELRMDVEDLRRDFEEYQRTHPDVSEPRLPSGAYEHLPSNVLTPATSPIQDAEIQDEGDAPAEESTEPDADDEGTVVFRSGMTMQDLEREAIMAALQEFGGNRRKAAEQLGIGERTLYRKIKEYEIPV